MSALAAEEPRSLILLDSSEYNLFRIQRHIKAAFPSMSCEFVLGSIGEPRLLDELFTRFRPQTIFQAAAFKHVALLERNPYAAVANNALGSYTLAKAAARHGVERLVFVSTDKAVHPRSVMGVSKRIAEIFTLSLSTASCRSNAVRLGNVIGSTGSVVPLFLEQLAHGESLTVTHPEASRYFLSIEETVDAILAAGNADCTGRVLLPQFTLPVRIAELAAFLAGTNELPTSYTGLQPGEKLCEELIARGETVLGTCDGPLTILQTPTIATAEVEAIAARLCGSIADRDTAGLIQNIQTLVPDYETSDLVDLSGCERL